jgi:hypothetical protein
MLIQRCPAKEKSWLEQVRLRVQLWPGIATGLPAIAKVAVSARDNLDLSGDFTPAESS